MKTRQPNREQRFTNELAEKLNSMGGIINKADRRAIAQAFERHFREVQQDTISAILTQVQPK